MSQNQVHTRIVTSEFAPVGLSSAPPRFEVAATGRSQDGVTTAKARALSHYALPVILLAVTAAFLTRPLGPWWLSADCDATYAASALNLMIGQPTEKLDHPGLPLQTLLTISLKLHHAITSLWTGESASQYVATTFADLSRILWIIRAWALFFLLCLVATVFLICRRCAQRAGRNQGEATLAGVAAVVLLLACPGTLTHATSFRPENVLTILSLLAAWGLIEALHERSVWRVVIGSAMVGLAITVKIHAVALVPVVAYVTWASTRWQRGVDRTAGTGLDAHEVDDLAVSVGGHSLRVAVAGAGWLLIVLCLNAGRAWTAMDPRILLAVGALASWTLLAAMVARSRRAFLMARRTPPALENHAPFTSPDRRATIDTFRFSRWISPIIPGVMLAGLLGMLLPNACFLDEVTPVLRAMWYTMRGAGGNGGTTVTTLAVSTWTQWTSPSLLPVWALGIASILGAIQAVRRGRARLLLFAMASCAALALAVVRGASHFSPHHYGLAMALSIPLMLEALGFLGAPRPVGTAASQPVWRLALTLVLCAWPMAAYERSARGQASRCAAIEELTALCRASLDEHEVILCDYWAQNADAAHFMQAREVSRYKPDLSYRSLPDTPTGLRYADQRGLRPAFYLTSGPARTRVTRVADGAWTAKGAWGQRWRVLPLAARDVGGLTLGAYLILERLEEPGADGPIASADPDDALTALRIGPTVAERRGDFRP